MKLYDFNERKEVLTHHVTIKPTISNADLVKLITLIHSENMATLRLFMNAFGYTEEQFEQMEQAYIDEIQKILN